MRASRTRSAACGSSRLRAETTLPSCSTIGEVNGTVFHPQCCATYKGCRLTMHICTQPENPLRHGTVDRFGMVRIESNRVVFDLPYSISATERPDLKRQSWEIGVSHGAARLTTPCLLFIKPWRAWRLLVGSFRVSLGYLRSKTADSPWHLRFRHPPPIPGPYRVRQRWGTWS